MISTNTSKQFKQDLSDVQNINKKFSGTGGSTLVTYKCAHRWQWRRRSQCWRLRRRVSSSATRRQGTDIGTTWRVYSSTTTTGATCRYQWASTARCGRSNSGWRWSSLATSTISRSSWRACARRRTPTASWLSRAASTWSTEVRDASKTCFPTSSSP